MLKKMLVIALTVFLLALSAYRPVNAQQSGEDDGGAGFISEIQGIVETKLQGKEEWVPAEQGQVIKQGDSVRTAKDAAAELSYESGGVTSLEGDSELSVKSVKSDYDNDDYETALDLVMGRILVNAGKVGSETLSFKVNTPVAVAAVRGTEFVVDVTGKEDAAIAAFSGSVQVTKIGSSDSVFIKKNKKISIQKKTTKLQKPVKLDKKTIKLKKKFITLKKKAVIHRKSIKLKRKTIALKKKSIHTIKKRVMLEEKPKVELKKKPKIR